MLLEFTGKDYKFVLDASGEEVRMVCGSLAGLVGGSLGIVNPLFVRTLPENRIAPFYRGEPEELDGVCDCDWFDDDDDEDEDNGVDVEELFKGRVVEREMSKEEMLFIVFCHRYGLLKSPEGEEIGLEF